MKVGDCVKISCPWANDQKLWFEIKGFNYDGGSSGFVYFHPKTGEYAAWYLSDILEVKEKPKDNYTETLELVED